MSHKSSSPARLRSAPLLLLCLAVLLPPPAARAQSAAAPTKGAQGDEEVVRISSELVQTDVMVFDRSGKFVEGLGQEQFELKVDGKPQPIAFFERVNAGSLNEDAQLAAARGGVGAARPATSAGGGVVPLDRGRTVFFFVDDLHISPASMTRTKSALQRFVDEEVGQNDEAAIISASGQVGFLQQLTGEKAVLNAALKRLNSHQSAVRDFENPPMTVVQALAVDRNDPQVINFFADAILRENPRMPRDTAINMVGNRARQLLQQTNHFTKATLTSLESVVRRSAPLPGRKLVFFISDGFALDDRNSDVRDRLRRLADAAARAGVVIYTMDARGLSTGLPDIGSAVAFDPAGQLASVNSRENASLQEPLRTIAADTGGRALLNNNALNLAVTRTLKETAVYYLLAWRPEGRPERSNPKFRRIEASVRGRSDLSVVVKRGFYTAPPEVSDSRGKGDKGKEKEANAAPATARSADNELFAALTSLYPRTSLPTSLALGYLSTANRGMLMTVSFEIDAEALTFALAPAAADAQPGQVASTDAVIAVYDSNGKAVTGFKQQFGFTAQPSPDGKRPPAVRTYQLPVTPGIYQVRAAARDQRSGRAGSAVRWIEVPELKPGRLALSSLFVAERVTQQQTSDLKDESLLEGVTLSVGRRFARNSWLRFVTFIYNAQGGAAQPQDVTLQVQVFRDDQPVITAPLRKVETDGTRDQARIPYAAEVPLESLPAGRYVLQVTAIDRVAKASASQRVSFMVE